MNKPTWVKRLAQNGKGYEAGIFKSDQYSLSINPVDSTILKTHKTVIGNGVTHTITLFSQRAGSQPQV